MHSTELLDLLGNENRRRMLKLLSERPCYVSELSGRLKVAPKAVIQHLEVLERAGLITSFKGGQRRKYYQISENILIEVSLSPYTFGIEVFLESLPPPQLAALLQKAPMLASHYKDVDSERQAASRVALSNIARRTEQLKNAHTELSKAQQSLQIQLVNAIDAAMEHIETLSSDALSAEIMAYILREPQTSRQLSSMLDLPLDVVEGALRKLKSASLITEQDSRWRLR